MHRIFMLHSNFNFSNARQLCIENMYRNVFSMEFDFHPVQLFVVNVES